MTKASVEISVQSQTGLVPSSAPPRVRPNATLLFWRRMIETTVADAKKTKNGQPTDRALLARWWISEFRPLREIKDEWEVSFECACHWLDEEPDEYRRKLEAEIDRVWIKASESARSNLIYTRRAMVLSCAGRPVAIAKQFILPLVSEEDYPDVANVDDEEVNMQTQLFGEVRNAS